MEEEAVLGEMLAMAQATRRAGGIVDRPGQAHGATRHAACKAGQDSGHPRRLRRRRPRAAADVCDVLRSELCRRAAHSGRRHQVAAVRTTQGDRPPRGDGALPGRHLQSRRRRFDRACRRSPPKKALLDACHPHQRAGHHRRCANHRPRLGRGAELCGDDRAACAVRLLRRRRARSRVSFVRRGRSRKATSTSAASATGSSASAASSTSARTRGASSSAAR